MRYAMVRCLLSLVLLAPPPIAAKAPAKESGKRFLNQNPQRRILTLDCNAHPYVDPQGVNYLRVEITETLVSGEVTKRIAYQHATGNQKEARQAYKGALATCMDAYDKEMR